MSEDIGVIKKRFCLPDGLPADAYVMPGTLANASEWKAKVWDGNAGDGDIAMDDIGYVMVSLKDNTIIPIARADEHHHGYATLREHKQEWGINLRDYIPIPAQGSPVYIYSSTEIPLYLEALRRFRSYGGRNVAINSQPQNGLDEQVILADDFLKAKGMIPLTPGELWPYGERLVRAIEALNDALGKAREAGSQMAEQRVFKAAWKLRDAMDANWFSVIRHLDGFTRFREEGEFTPNCVDRLLTTWEAIGDTKALEEAVFGFSDDWVGFKPSLHREVRKELAGERTYSRVKSLFGDLELANDRLGRAGWNPSEDPDVFAGLRV